MKLLMYGYSFQKTKKKRMLRLGVGGRVRPVRSGLALFGAGQRRLGRGAGEDHAGTDHAADALNAEGGGTQDREVGLEIERAFKLILGLKEAPGDDAQQLDLGGELGQRNRIGEESLDPPGAGGI
jgi:hypothetical protein